MKSYILIQNDGEIETGAFELIGASTKRGQEGKIGFFGSGLKYSIAYMLRSGIHFRIFSGTNEMIFTTKKEIFRNQEFERICINGVPTSYTTTMGPTWREDWFILREIYCNAIDEKNCQLIKEIFDINPSEGKTRIFIELTDKLRGVIENWNSYFSIDREPLFEKHKVHTYYLGTADNIKSYEEAANQTVKVFHKTLGVLFRRGVRVFSSDRYLYDYETHYVDINEDRTVKNHHGVAYMHIDLMFQFANYNYVLSVLRTGESDLPCYEYSSLTSCKANGAISAQWVEFSKQFLLVLKEKSGKFANQIAETNQEVLLIPVSFARELKRCWPDIRIIGLGKVVEGVDMSECEPHPKVNYLLKEVLKTLEEMGYAVPYPINIVNFGAEDILGHADLKNKQIYLAEKTFDLGRREIATTIIEEVEHIKSQKGDETREFQNHLVSQWLKTMEEKSALFL